MRVMQHFNEQWTNQATVDLKGLIAECPPAMASNLAELLFARFLHSVPLFRGLSPEIISALCLRCTPMTIMAGHTIIRQGEPGM